MPQHMAQTEAQRFYDFPAFVPHEPCGHVIGPACLYCLEYDHSNRMVEAFYPIIMEITRLNGEANAILVGEPDDLSYEARRTVERIRAQVANLHERIQIVDQELTESYDRDRAAIIARHPAETENLPQAPLPQAAPEFHFPPVVQNRAPDVANGQPPRTPGQQPNGVNGLSRRTPGRQLTNGGITRRTQGGSVNGLRRAPSAANGHARTPIAHAPHRRTLGAGGSAGNTRSRTSTSQQDLIHPQGTLQRGQHPEFFSLGRGPGGLARFAVPALSNSAMRLMLEARGDAYMDEMRSRLELLDEEARERREARRPAISGPANGDSAHPGPSAQAPPPPPEQEE